MADKVFSWCTKGGLNVQGEGAQAPSAGSLKHRQLQDVFVQMHGNVSSQFIWEVMQQLKQKTGKLEPLLTTAVHLVVQQACRISEYFFHYC